MKAKAKKGGRKMEQLYLHELKSGEVAYRIYMDGTIEELEKVKATSRSVHVKIGGKVKIIRGWGTQRVFRTKVEAVNWLKKELTNRIKARYVEIHKMEETLNRLG